MHAGNLRIYSARPNRTEKIAPLDKRGCIYEDQKLLWPLHKFNQWSRNQSEGPNAMKYFAAYLGSPDVPTCALLIVTSMRMKQLKRNGFNRNLPTRELNFNEYLDLFKVWVTQKGHERYMSAVLTLDFPGRFRRTLVSISLASLRHPATAGLHQTD